ncbi:DUF3575 domain-containing protein [uncultured Alistipes sp.]|jgi:hypothetical protein|uniref:DUF3575 domain-containing protein n=1 Tax=uncultured Alistipes sp. TaxID=538949 RepID=UPI0025FC8C64|nr:DUF3575 domain-containing protein [uncultured Alistipes sp.]
MMITRIKTPLLLTLLLLFTAMSPASAQQKSIRLAAEEQTVGQTLEQIKSQTECLFSSRISELRPERIVRFASQTVTVDDALQTIIQGTGLTYSQQGKYIVFEMAKPSALPAKPIQLVSQYGDRYERGDYSVFNNTNRRRPLPPPVIEIVDNTQVQSDTVRSLNTDNFTSYIVPVQRYADNKLPVFSLKTNLLYGFGMLTPNLAAEIGLGRRTTLEVSGSYNGWNLSGSLTDNKKIAHWIIRPEFRYWLCERFNGHFFGVHAFYAKYNVGDVKVPLLFEKKYRYEGDAFGGGITYGYHLPLSKRWGLEFNVGVGVARLKYDRFPCAACSYDPEKGVTKTYFGPTRAGITVTFNIH